MWVDFSAEVPGHWDYIVPAKASPPKWRVSRFFPNMQQHGGGTFNWDAPKSKAGHERLMQKHPMPPHRVRFGYTVRSLAARLTGQQHRSGVKGGVVSATIEDVAHIAAKLLDGAKYYDATRHLMLGIISNDVPRTPRGFQRAVGECRRGMGGCGSRRALSALSTLAQRCRPPLFYG